MIEMTIAVSKGVYQPITQTKSIRVNVMESKTMASHQRPWPPMAMPCELYSIITCLWSPSTDLGATI